MTYERNIFRFDSSRRFKGVAMTFDKMIEIIQAHIDGKPIEYRSKSPCPAWTRVDNPDFNFSICDYRIAPSPMEEAFQKFFSQDNIPYSVEIIFKAGWKACEEHQSGNALAGKEG